MYFSNSITLITLISLIIYINSQNSAYLAMSEEMEAPLKKYLDFSFSNHLIPGVKLQKVRKYQ